ncbi:hypothetical protein L1987_33587 [Smallanthus sonchifolius]|uniref:Uncharacterized protein n=1 Tax=Smallanthus sonchifolius TaxID=185202 RepID=A0ACB9HSN5_9ASTR|nr:hypothetical protein L1987_33587 [Smallanthus sonchifolius]
MSKEELSTTPSILTEETTCHPGTDHFTASTGSPSGPIITLGASLVDVGSGLEDEDSMPISSIRKRPLPKPYAPPLWKRLGLKSCLRSNVKKPHVHFEKPNSPFSYWWFILSHLWLPKEAAFADHNIKVETLLSSPVKPTVYVHPITSSSTSHTFPVTVTISSPLAVTVPLSQNPTVSTSPPRATLPLEGPQGSGVHRSLDSDDLELGDLVFLSERERGSLFVP